MQKLTRKRRQSTRPKGVVAKVRAAVTQENPPTQRSIANRIGTSKGTVYRIIHKNLGLERRHKARGHVLKEQHIRERFTNARKLYEHHLAGEKWQWVVSLDEAWIYLDDTNKPRAIYYKPVGQKRRSNFIRENKEKFSKGFMVVAGYCARGQLKIHRVAKNVKINAAYYQKNVMDPIFHEEIPRLYSEDTPNVWIHMDKASSHTARSSQDYYHRKAVETGVNVIPFKRIPVKSPDASPMDFCGFGLLKQRLASRRPTTIEGLWKVCQEEWANIPLPVLRRSLLQWKLRCRDIVQAHGFHIEHNRWWRKGISP